MSSCTVCDQVEGPHGADEVFDYYRIAINGQHHYGHLCMGCKMSLERLSAGVELIESYKRALGENDG